MRSYVRHRTDQRHAGAYQRFLHVALRAIFEHIMKTTEELRRGQRIAVAMWVRLRGGGTELGMARITDASISGAFLETAIRLPVNAKIALEAVSSAGDAAQDLKMAARVARVDHRGLGIEWQAMIRPQVLALLMRAVPGSESRD
jgi:hypothetical protein